MKLLVVTSACKETLRALEASVMPRGTIWKQS